MSVMIGVPVKDSGAWLPRFLQQLEKLKDVSRIVFSYSRSEDNTLQTLKHWENETQHSTEIIHEPAMPEALSAAEIAPVYKDFQEIFGEKGWEDETNFLLIDADIMDVPDDLIQRLMAHDKDIIAPFVYIDRMTPRQFFDVHCFRLSGFRFHPYLPPDPYDGEIFELDSVGCCYLVKRDTFKFVDYDNPHPHMRFCENALDAGYEVWADPSTEILHLDPTKFGISKTPIELLRGKDFNPPPFIKKDGSVVSNDECIEDMVNALVWGKTE